MYNYNAYTSNAFKKKNNEVHASREAIDEQK